MYTWGYLKESILSKLDLVESDGGLSDSDEVEIMNYSNRFKYYANEAMTQICSSVKPKRTFFEVEIHDGKYDEFGNLVEPSNLNAVITLPDDFISFGDDTNIIEYYDQFNDFWQMEAHDEDFEYRGYNQIICHTVGKYSISYNARWLIFGNQDNDTILEAPIDILECIPSYVASQCMKVDDEVKSSIFRDEYELMLARIDDTNFKTNKTFKIGGDW